MLDLIFWMRRLRSLSAEALSVLSADSQPPHTPAARRLSSSFFRTVALRLSSDCANRTARSRFSRASYGSATPLRAGSAGLSPCLRTGAADSEDSFREPRSRINWVYRSYRLLILGFK